MNWVRRQQARLRKLHGDERGQTPTEYLMIVGLMAVVIVVAFVYYFWDNVKGAAKEWSKNSKEAISGKLIKN